MSEDWPRQTVAKLQEQGVLLVEDGNHGEYRPRADEFCSSGTAFIRASDMDGGRVLFNSASQINETALTRIRKGVGRAGDILFSHKGTVGKLALVPDDCPPFVCSPQTTYWRSLDSNRLDRRYLYCYMQSTEFRNQWSSRKGETDMADYVSLTAQRELLVAVPPIREQRAIAECLSALDDKIELNRKMNETLEAMARSLFKSWFVDFDPVTAKAAGRKPFGMTDDLAALFPGDFTESDQGPIPKGWNTCSLGDLVDLKRGHDLPERERRVGQYPIYSSAGLTGYHDTCKAAGPGVVTGRYGTIGLVFYIDGDFWPLNTTLYVRDFKGNDSRCMAYLLETIDFQQFADKAAVPGINRNHVHKAKVVAPPPLLQTQFARATKVYHQHARTIRDQIRTLIQLRDSLLPLLLSGEIRLRNAERKIREIV